MFNFYGLYPCAISLQAYHTSTRNTFNHNGLRPVRFERKIHGEANIDLNFEEKLKAGD